MDLLQTILLKIRSLRPAVCFLSLVSLALLVSLSSCNEPASNTGKKHNEAQKTESSDNDEANAGGDAPGGPVIPSQSPTPFMPDFSNMPGGAMGGAASPSPPPPAANGDNSCLNGLGSAFDAKGKFSFQTTSKGAVKIYAPQGIPGGCKVPIVHFSNGTAMNCGFYASILQHLASWGFLVACYESPMTGAGTQCMEGLSTLLTDYAAIADNKIGSTGHSQGGGASITCAYLAEKKWGDQVKIAVSAIQPAHGMSRASYTSEYPQVKSPIFIMSGSVDMIVNDAWIEKGYSILKTETLWYRAMGIGHMDHHNTAMSSTVAYFRWKLLGDPEGEKYITGLGTTITGWQFVKKK
jgi:hypothetical protein